MGQRRALLFWRSRLSQRIVLSVFVSIVVIEAVILIPSVYRRERELLNQLSALSSATLGGAMGEAGVPRQELTPEQLLQWVSRAVAIPAVLGGTLYTQTGDLVGRFGEAPQLTYDRVIHQGDRHLLNRGDRRYDALWEMSPLEGQYLLIVRHDSTGIRRELIHFMGRIGGLVVIISAVVTLTTLVVLRSILINPVLALRDDLRQAAAAALQEEAADPSMSAPSTHLFASVRYRQDDELGEVIMAFQEMFERISGAIAEQRRVERMLRESETRFRTLVEQAAETIVVLDEQATILDVNQFGLSYLGYRRNELVGHSLFHINPNLSRSRYEAHWQALQAGEPVTTETLHRRKDGQIFPVEVRSGLIRIDGQQRLLSLVRDISLRKQAEKAQARLAEIGELAAMIVHEVRNPLATVYMALTGFKRMALPQAGQLRLELALEESERLQRLLNEILAYAKEQQLVAQDIELSALLEELRQSLQMLPSAQGRCIAVTDHGQKLRVRGDRDKLKQVFINLVTNACEAIAEGETVTWKLEECDRWVKITVCNGGTPIPPEVLPKLTQPFFSTKAGGNGLGLAITQRIVEAHGGHLTIESDAARGTVITVSLPRLLP